MEVPEDRSKNKKSWFYILKMRYKNQDFLMSGIICTVHYHRFYYFV